MQQAKKGKMAQGVSENAEGPDKNPKSPSDGDETPPTSGSPASGRKDPPPSSKPEEVKKEIVWRIDNGDLQGARRLIRRGLERDPKDAELVMMDQLLPQHVTADLSSRDLKEKAAALLGSPDDAEAGRGASSAQGQGQSQSSPQVLVASPISWAAPAQNQAAAALMAGQGQASPKMTLPQEALVKISLKDYPAAEKALSLNIRENPDNWAAFRMRALIRRQLKNFQGAFEDSSRAFKLNPKDSRSRHVKTLSLLDMMRTPEAMEEANAAIDENPRDPEALAARAMIWEKLGRLEEEIADLKLAAQIDPHFDSLYREALGRRENNPRDPSRPSSAPHPMTLFFAGLGTALVAAASLLWIKRRDTLAARRRLPAMRLADRISERASEIQAPLMGFQILNTLGRGGMGVVYEAMDEVLQRKVAVKKMRDEIAGDPQARRRFLKEARTVASLKHPNIVEIHSVLENGQDLYLVFEHVEGAPLHSLIEPSRPLPLHQALEYSRQIAQALDYAHAQGIIHQDLKPSNIMIAQNRVKVMDFGIARKAQETLSTLSMAQPVGTPGYMAPEQEQGQFFKESDIYSFGVCFYEMLAGKVPFSGLSFFQKVQKTYEPLSRANAKVPTAVDTVMEKALSLLPKDRHHSAQAFVQDVERACLNA
ncbi:MAG: protein kinase [Elusimicrobia bacterium]|nr:protein kinase [Elusimicrobiota bacterium]